MNVNSIVDLVFPDSSVQVVIVQIVAPQMAEGSYEMHLVPGIDEALCSIVNGRQSFLVAHHPQWQRRYGDNLQR